MAGAKGKHSRLSRDVVQSIRDLIVGQNLEPGDKLPSERKLIDHLGLSRGPIREALRVLEIMGVVEVRPEAAYMRANPKPAFYPGGKPSAISQGQLVSSSRSPDSHRTWGGFHGRLAGQYKGDGGHTPEL